MSFYTRELQEVPEPVEVFVAKSLYFGRHGDIEILFMDSEEDIPERGYQYPFRVILASENDASEWKEIYRNAEIRDSLPNRSREEIDDDNQQSKKDHSRLDELEQAGKLAEAKWQLLVNAPNFIGRVGQEMQQAVFAFDSALQAAETLGLHLSEEDKEQNSRLGVFADQYGDLYKLAARLAMLEERFFPQAELMMTEVEKPQRRPREPREPREPRQLKDRMPAALS